MARIRAEEGTRYSEVIRVYKDLKEVRERYEPEWEKINDLVLPRRSDFDWVKHAVKKARRPIYDPLPGYLARKAADGIMGNTLNRGNSWFRIHSADPNLDRSRIFRMHIEEVEQVLYSLLRKSTLYGAAQDAVMDCLTVGHTALYREIEEGTDRVIYTARHPKEIYISQNRHGVIDTVVRKFWLEARAVVDEYGRENLPDRFLNDADTNPYELKTLIHLVRPRKDRNPEKADKWNMPFESVTVLEEAAEVIRDSGYRRFPYPAIWRWRTNTGELYARSPSWDALPDIIRLNEVSRTMIQFTQEAVDPPLQYPLEMKGKIDRRPRGMTPYTDPSRQVRRLYESGSAFPLGYELIKMLRDQISEAFYADVFTTLMMYQEKNRTATEVMELVNEKASLMASVTERFTAEFAGPVIEDLYLTAYENGWLPEVPDALLEQNLNVTLEFLGPLAQGQRRHYQTSGINAAIQQFATSAQMWPEILDAVDPMQLARAQALASGVPEKVMRSESQIRQLQRAREEAMQAQMEAQQMQQQASAYAQMTKAPEPGSAAEGMR